MKKFSVIQGLLRPFTDHFGFSAPGFLSYRAGLRMLARPEMDVPPDIPCPWFNDRVENVGSLCSGSADLTNRLLVSSVSIPLFYIRIPLRSSIAIQNVRRAVDDHVFLGLQQPTGRCVRLSSPIFPFSSPSSCSRKGSSGGTPHNESSDFLVSPSARILSLVFLTSS